MTTLTLFPHERAVQYVDGVFTRVLEPGRHRLPRRATCTRVGVLERIVTTAPQEVLTSDGVTVRLTVAISWRITDPRAFVETVVDPAAVVYLAVQMALRGALVELDAEAVVRRAGPALTEALTQAARTAGGVVGIEVREAVLKDVMLPPELRHAYAELATTRTRGQAQLEAARAESAALRSLANSAKLLDDHPALARLRLVQALPMGTTLELDLGERD